mgnify:CR=1 FL=1
MDTPDILVLQASYTNPVHAEAIALLLNHYAEDPMGGGHSLPAELGDGVFDAFGEFGDGVAFDLFFEELDVEAGEFLDEAAASALDDKVLDAGVDDEGSVSFAVLPQVA